MFAEMISAHRWLTILQSSRFRFLRAYVPTMSAQNMGLNLSFTECLFNIILSIPLNILICELHKPARHYPACIRSVNNIDTKCLVWRQGSNPRRIG